MAKNKINKLLSNIEKEELIRRLVVDIATRENESFSSIIERALLTALLPVNSEARLVAEQYLYSEDGGTSRALTVVFRNNSGKTVHMNLLPLVEFAYEQESRYFVTLNGNEEVLPHLRQQIKALIEILEKSAEENNKVDILCCVEHVEKLLQELKNEPSRSRLFNFYQIVKDNWKYLKQWDATYKVLADLTQLASWQETPEAKVELLELLRTLSEE